jgi:hypothetical protein
MIVTMREIASMSQALKQIVSRRRRTEIKTSHTRKLKSLGVVGWPFGKVPIHVGHGYLHQLPVERMQIDNMVHPGTQLAPPMSLLIGELACLSIGAGFGRARVEAIELMGWR